jgi:hypothetical protein
MGGGVEMAVVVGGGGGGEDDGRIAMERKTDAITFTRQSPSSRVD